MCIIHLSKISANFQLRVWIQKTHLSLLSCKTRWGCWEVFPFSFLHLHADVVRRRRTGMCWKHKSSHHITAVPHKRAGMPESWVPLTLVPSERWYHWCKPTGPGSCCHPPLHLKHILIVNIMRHWINTTDWVIWENSRAGICYTVFSVVFLVWRKLNEIYQSCPVYRCKTSTAGKETKWCLVRAYNLSFFM